MTILPRSALEPSSTDARIPSPALRAGPMTAAAAASPSTTYARRPSGETCREKVSTATTPTGPPPAPHTGIFAQAHSAVALTPFEHLSLRIIPQNQTWVQLRPSYFRRDPADGLWFSTIGAGPGPNADVGRCFGTLTSDVNRDSDVNDPILFFERLQYGNGFASSIVEDVLIQDFFRRALKENGGYQNNLAYVCLPSAFAGDFTYNSNSFFAGLLDVVHIFPRPAFATSQAWRFPGFNKPVPTQWFGQ